MIRSTRSSIWALVNSYSAPCRVDVLASREIPAEAGGELEQRHDPAAARGLAGLERHDSGEHAQRRGLAGAVAADHTDGLSRLDVQRDALERGYRGRAVRSRSKQGAFERVRLIGPNAERARRVAEDDLPGFQRAAQTTTANSP